MTVSIYDGGMIFMSNANSKTTGGPGRVKSEASLTFTEATSIIIGHGVGSGILAVPYLASRNSMAGVLFILAAAYTINLIMHLMIAELSLFHGGAQFIACFERELFVGRIKKPATWIAFFLLGFSVLVNVSGFIVGAGDVLFSWLHIPVRPGMILYYILAAAVVLFGMKLVGICEKISVFLMGAVMLILLVAVAAGHMSPPAAKWISSTNMIVLYSMVSFSLSAVMSVPQVVKGLDGKVGEIRKSIVCGTGINLLLICLITCLTLIGAGAHITTRGALVDLSEQLGGWISVIGYIFSLLALSTSFWANTLNLRDVINEQLHLGEKVSWAISTFPSLIIALLGIGSFVGFVRLAGVVQILTGLGVIAAYHQVRKKQTFSPVCGISGSLLFQIAVAAGAVLATVGALFRVK